MNLRETIQVALDTLRAHKLRSALTLLGVIVSVWTLVAVVSLVDGVNRYVGDKVAHLGSNTFQVSEFSLDQMTNQKAYTLAQKTNQPITTEEYQYIRAHAELPAIVGAGVSNSNAEVRAHGRSLDDVSIRGVTANRLPTFDFDIAAGRFLTSADEQHRASVAVLGPDIVNQLYAGLDPLGDTVNVDGHDYLIVGVATAQGNVFGQSQDNWVMIPLSTYQELYGSKDSLQIVVQARDAADIDPTTDEVRALLRGYRHLRPDQADTFGFIGAASLMSLWNRLTGEIAAVMVGVSAVFLVVGGIVIMNIMLAAVIERTREIGIRKAVGARRRDILNQFLVESAVLSTLGGAIGVGLAYAFTLLAGLVTPLPFSLPWGAVAVALVISTAVGLFFGLYPARKAAALDPIVALRSEI